MALNEAVRAMLSTRRRLLMGPAYLSNDAYSAASVL